MKHIHHVLIAGLLLAAGPNHAEQPPPAAPTPEQIEQLNRMFFTEFDRDQDEQVTREEFLASDNARFDFMDSNADGIIDPGEVAAFTRRMLQEAPAR